MNDTIHVYIFSECFKTIAIEKNVRVSLHTTNYVIVCSVIKIHIRKNTWYGASVVHKQVSILSFHVLQSQSPT